MSKQMTNTIKKCETCAKFAINNKGNQELKQHDIGESPWMKIGVDLCDLNGRQLLVVTDYYSSYISVERLTNTTTSETNLQLLNIFAIHGIPQNIVSDNGPQFRTEFKNFAENLDIETIFSSPYYPKSNGKAENAVKIIKHLFKKANDTKRSEQLALLEWNNTISEGEQVSPSEKLFGRKTRTMLPIVKKLLLPREDRKEEILDMKKRKEKQIYYYDKSTRNYERIKTNENVHVKLNGDKTWSKGRMKEEISDRKYIVEINNKEYIRNRKHIKTDNIKEEHEDNETEQEKIVEETKIIEKKEEKIEEEIENKENEKIEEENRRPQRKRWLLEKLGGGLVK